MIIVLFSKEQFDSYHRPFQAICYDFKRDINDFLCLPKKWSYESIWDSGEDMRRKNQY